MSGAARDILKHIFRDHYDSLLASLSRRLGSRELARDALHDAFLRLDRAEIASEVHRPSSYILRMASNIAANLRRRQSRLLCMDDVAAILEIPDTTQDVVGTEERRSELEAMKQALQSLPERRRSLLIAAWLDEIPTAELAVQYGIAVRTVQHELKLALEQLRREVAQSDDEILRENDPREVLRYKSRIRNDDAGRNE